MALVMNSLGQWDYVVDSTSDSSMKSSLFPGFLTPAPDTQELKSGSFFSIPFVNQDSIVAPEQGTGVYSRVKAQVSRLADSLRSGVASVTTSVTNAASGIATFWQSTLWKVLLILIVAAVILLFGYSFIQAKAGRMANA